MEPDKQLEMKIEQLVQKSDDELLDVIGAYALSQEPTELRETMAVDGILDSRKLRKAARKFMSDMDPILTDALCGPDGIVHYMEQPTVKDIVTVLLPVLGLTSLGAIPTALIAIGVIIIRSGLREYCKVHQKEKKK